MTTGYPAAARRRARPEPRVPVPPMMATVGVPVSTALFLEFHLGQRHDGNASLFQAGANRAGHGHASCFVAMDAESVHVDLHLLAVARNDLPVANHAHCLLGGLLRILQNRALNGAGGKVAVIVVKAVGET